MGLKIRLNNVRLGFAQQLFTPSAVEEGKEPKFGCDSLLVRGHSVQKAVDTGKKDGDGKAIFQWQATTMEQVLKDVADETIKGGKGATWLASLENSKKCYRNGDTRVTKGGDPYEGYEGVWYVAAKSKSRPLIIDEKKNPLTIADGKPYSGCYANVVVEVYGMGDPKKKGVHAAIKSVQFVKDGDAFGGGAPSSPDDFDEIADGAGAGDVPAASGGGDDASDLA